MNSLQKLTRNIDKWQQNHRLPAFLYAVIKKYGEDHAGYQSALLTYYGFLSLFPLLLVLTTVAGQISGSHPDLQNRIVTSMTDYFPVLGSQLSEHVHTLHKTGLALAVGILVTFYGARGVADAFRHGVNHIWGTTKAAKEGFPKSVLRSLALIVIGGFGLLLASIAAGLTASAGRGLDFRLLSIAVNLFILFWLFTFLLNISLPKHVPLRDLRAAAATAAVGLVILQIFGGYLLARELKSLDALYSNFAIPLGLLFWIYLQTQVLYYSVEVAAVKAHRKWPRSLNESDETAS
jgi:YihY family inner membrane protein